jgi:hypothetical protein
MRIPVAGATLLAAALAALAPGAKADPMMDATEALIVAAQDSFSYLPRLFGVNSSSVSFDSFVDPLGTSISFAARPGSTYAGQALSLSVTGAFAPATQTWSFASIGSIGSNSLDGDGTLVLAAFGAGNDRWSIRLFGHEVDIESRHKVTHGGVPGARHDFSVDFFVYTVDGNAFSPFKPSIDDVERATDISYDFSFTDDISFGGAGSQDVTTGIGAFAITVDEPGGLGVLGMGMAALLASALHSRLRSG